MMSGLKVGDSDVDPVSVGLFSEQPADEEMSVRPSPDAALAEDGPGGDLDAHAGDAAEGDGGEASASGPASEPESRDFTESDPCVAEQAPNLTNGTLRRRGRRERRSGFGLRVAEPHEESSGPAASESFASEGDGYAAEGSAAASEESSACEESESCASEGDGYAAEGSAAASEESSACEESESCASEGEGYSAEGSAAASEESSACEESESCASEGDGYAAEGSAAASEESSACEESESCASEGDGYAAEGSAAASEESSACEESESCASEGDGYAAEGSAAASEESSACEESESCASEGDGYGADADAELGGADDMPSSLSAHVEDAPDSAIEASSGASYDESSFETPADLGPGSGPFLATESTSERPAAAVSQAFVSAGPEALDSDSGASSTLGGSEGHEAEDGSNAFEPPAAAHLPRARSRMVPLFLGLVLLLNAGLLAGMLLLRRESRRAVASVPAISVDVKDLRDGHADTRGKLDETRKELEETRARLEETRGAVSRHESVLTTTVETVNATVQRQKVADREAREREARETRELAILAARVTVVEKRADEAFTMSLKNAMQVVDAVQGRPAAPEMPKKDAPSGHREKKAAH